ncbi:MAG: DUF6159 family protein [Thermoanaerobaculia bacterium]|nr:DUF6159 family protein [Thermoanaerobaculia bacterium]
MMQRLRNSWAVMKTSAAALNADRELLVFPLVSAIATLIVSLTFIVPVVISGAWQMVGDESTGKIIGALFLWCFYFVLATITVYCNTALVGAAMIRFDGGDPTLADGLRVASSRFSTILGYAAISASVGLLLKVIQGKGGKLQAIVASIVGVGWSLATFLIVPVLAANDIGPIEAVKQSGLLFKKTWGEQVVGAGGIRLVSGIAVVLLILIGGISITLAAATESVALIITVAVLFGLALGLLLLVTAALQGIYSAALYRYATTGVGAFGFEPTQLGTAFRAKR